MAPNLFLVTRRNRQAEEESRILIKARLQSRWRGGHC